MIPKLNLKKFQNNYSNLNSTLFGLLQPKEKSELFYYKRKSIEHHPA